jgi:outer membrane murein-binding lipoprotein Lpp
MNPPSRPSVAEPVSPVGWAAILAAVLLPTLVAAGGWWGAQAREAELHQLRARAASQDAQIERLERQVEMLEADLDAVLDFE